MRQLALLCLSVCLSLPPTSVRAYESCGQLLRTYLRYNFLPHKVNGKLWYPPSTSSTDAKAMEIAQFVNGIENDNGHQKVLLSHKKGRSVGVVFGRKNGVEVYLVALSGDAQVVSSQIMPHFTAAKARGEFHNIIFLENKVDTTNFLLPLGRERNANSCVEPKLMAAARELLDEQPNAMSVVLRGGRNDEKGNWIPVKLDPCDSCALNCDRATLDGTLKPETSKPDHHHP